MQNKNEKLIKMNFSYTTVFQKTIFPIYEKLFGRNTIKKLKEFEKTQYYDEKRFQNYFKDRLLQFITMAARNVPYYKNLLKDFSDLYSLDFFEEIPFLTREILKENFHKLQNLNYNGKTHVQFTGGSTGHPVQFLSDRCRESSTIAFRLRAHRWFDINIGDKEIVIWGAPIELGRQDYIRTFRDYIFRSRLISAFNFTEHNMEEALKIIKNYKPKSIFGYAQSIYLLANYAKLNMENSKNLWCEVIFSTAEPLYDFQRKEIEKTFQANVAVEYGARDAGLIAHECPKGNLHINAERILVEIVDNHGRILPKGQIGEIVITNLDTPSMPIIRYRTGDMGMLLDKKCPCGRVLPLMEVVGGRISDFLTGKDGKKIHPLGGIYILREIDKIEQFRIIQNDINYIIIELKLKSPLLKKEYNKIKKQFNKLLGLPVNIIFDEKNHIPTSKSGKYRHVISHVTL